MFNQSAKNYFLGMIVFSGLILFITNAQAQMRTEIKVVDVKTLITTEEQTYEPDPGSFYNPGPFDLKVTVSGSGTVKIIKPRNIDCPMPTCQKEFNSGDKVILQAIPEIGSVFVKWYVLDNLSYEPYYLSSPEGFTRGTIGEPCPSYFSGNSCKLVMDGDIEVYAEFTSATDVDLKTTSLKWNSIQALKDLPITITGEFQNVGKDKSQFTHENVFIEQIRYVNPNFKQTWYDGFGRLYNPGFESGETRSITKENITLPREDYSKPSSPPREGKYIVKTEVTTILDTNPTNNSLSEVFYITNNATAVLKGNIILYKDARIKKGTVLALSGAESRTIPITDGDTNYIFKGLKLGQYTLSLNISGYQPVKHTFEILNGKQIKKINVGLKKQESDPTKLNKAPVAIAVATPVEGLAETFTLDASGSYDPDGDSIRYLWDFGDGFTYKKGKSFQYRFDLGMTNVQLTVIDPLGASSSYTVTVQVKPSPQNGIKKTSVVVPTRTIPATPVDEDGEFWGP